MTRAAEEKKGQMENFNPETFGQLNAADYDDLQDPGTTDATVGFIADLVGQGRVLELAIGTGRIALPLAARGFDLMGIEASPEMVTIMRAKPGGDAIPVVIDDMARVAVDGLFDHVFLVFNTIFNLLTQEAQVACFRNVAQRLRPGGTFLVETFVPRFDGFVDNHRTSAKNITRNGVWLDAIAHDASQQTLDYQRVRITDAGMKLVPFAMRYIYPAEMDLMAQLAGMRLQARYGGWHKEPFTADSRMHVSVYEMP